MSVRLPPEAEKALDKMVADGGYKDRSETIREALSLLMQILEEKRAGRIVVAVDRKALDRAGLAVQIA